MTISKLSCLVIVFAGSAVAVEHIFSGGQDTVSMRRMRLKPETVGTLILVKAKLRLARTALKDLI